MEHPPLDGEGWGGVLTSTEIQHVAHPLPTSPVKGEVRPGGCCKTGT